MKRYELTKKEWLETSVFRISLVKDPAIEEDFIYMSKDDKINFSINQEKRMIYSPVLIPNKIIPRKTESGEPYEIFLSGDTIEEIARDYMLKKTTLGEWNLEHDESVKLEGIDVVENWIVEDPESDKSTKLGFKVPKQTWMQGAYISDDKVWNLVKDGTVKGVSVEMEMNHELKLNKSEMSETNRIEQIESKVGLLEKLFSSKKTKLASMEVGEGVVIYGDSFESGAMVYADEAMTVPFEGSFEKDGNTYTVEAGVILTESKPEEMEQDFKAELESLMKALNLSVEATQNLSNQLSESNKTIESLKTELSNVKEATELNSEKLSKIDKDQPKSVTTLSKEDSQKLTNLQKFNII